MPRFLRPPPRPHLSYYRLLLRVCCRIYTWLSLFSLSFSSLHFVEKMWHEAVSIPLSFQFCGLAWTVFSCTSLLLELFLLSFPAYGGKINFTRQRESYTWLHFILRPASIHFHSFLCLLNWIPRKRFYTKLLFLCYCILKFKTQIRNIFTTHKYRGREKWEI